MTWGTAHKSVGTSSNHVDYIFPGHNVVQERGSEQRADKANLLTGSSVATAFAAGLAALILRCVQFAAQQLLEEGGKGGGGRSDEMSRHLEDLKTRERMQEAFEQIRSITINNTKYVEVWNVFEVPGTKIEDEDPVKEREWALKIAERLVGQIRMT